MTTAAEYPPPPSLPFGASLIDSVRTRHVGPVGGPVPGAREPPQRWDGELAREFLTGASGLEISRWETESS